MSQASGDQERKQRFPRSPVKEFDEKRTRGGLRGGWKAVPPSAHTTPGRRAQSFLGLTQFQRNCASWGGWWTILYPAVTVMHLVCLTSGYLPWKAEERGPAPSKQAHSSAPSLPFRMQDSLSRVAFWCSCISKFLSDNSIRKMSQLKYTFLIFFGLTVQNKKINLFFPPTGWVTVFKQMNWGQKEKLMGWSTYQYKQTREKHIRISLERRR